MQFSTFALLAASASYATAAIIDLNNVPSSVTAAANLPRASPDSSSGDDGDDTDADGHYTGDGIRIGGSVYSNGAVITDGGSGNGNSNGNSGDGIVLSGSHQTIQVFGNSLTISNGVTLGAVAGSGSGSGSGAASATPTGSAASKPGGSAQTGTSVGSGAAAVTTSATTHNAAPTKAAMAWELMGAVVVGLGAAAL